MEGRQRIALFLIFVLGSFIIETASALRCRNCAESTGLPGCMSFDQLNSMGLNIRNYGSFSSKMSTTNPVVCLKYSMSFSLRGINANVVIRSGMSESVTGSGLDDVFQMFGSGARQTTNVNGMKCTSTNNVDLAGLSSMAGGFPGGTARFGGLGGIQVHSMEFCECSTDSCNDPDPPKVSSDAKSLRSSPSLREYFDESSDEDDWLPSTTATTTTTTEDVPFDFALDPVNSSPLGYRKYGQVATSELEGQQVDKNFGRDDHQLTNRVDIDGFNGTVSTFDTAPSLTMTEHMELMKAQLEHLEKYVHDIGTQISRNTIILGGQAGIAWVNNNGRTVPDGSLEAGFQKSEMPGTLRATQKNLHVARAWVSGGDLVVGQHLSRSFTALMPVNKRAVTVPSYQILVVPDTDVTWIPFKNGKGKYSLTNAIAGGVQKDGQPIFIGRTVYENEWAVGSVRLESGPNPIRKLFIARNGVERTVDQFEILALKSD